MDCHFAEPGMEESVIELDERVNSLGKRADALQSCIAEEKSQRQRDVAQLRGLVTSIDNRIEANGCASALRDVEAQVHQLMEAACRDLQARLQREVDEATSAAVAAIAAQLRATDASSPSVSDESKNAQGQEAPPEEVPGDLSSRQMNAMAAVSNILEARASGPLHSLDQLHQDTIQPLVSVVSSLEGEIGTLSTAMTELKADSKLSGSVVRLDISKLRNDQTGIKSDVKILQTQVEANNKDLQGKFRDLQKAITEEGQTRQEKDREIADKLGAGLTYLIQRLDQGLQFDADGTAAELDDLCSQAQDSCSGKVDNGADQASDLDRRVASHSDCSVTSATEPPSSLPATATGSGGASIATPSSASASALRGRNSLGSTARTLPLQPVPPTPTALQPRTPSRLSHDATRTPVQQRLQSSPLVLARNSVGSAHLPGPATDPRNLSPARGLQLCGSPPGSPWLGRHVVTHSAASGGSPPEARGQSPSALTLSTSRRSISPSNRPHLNMHQSALMSPGVPSPLGPSPPPVLQASQAVPPHSTPVPQIRQMKVQSPPPNPRLSWSSKSR